MDDMQTRIEHKMNAQAEASTSQHKAIQDEIKKDVESIEKRVGALERWKWYVIGAVGVIGYLIGHIETLSRLFK
jgi:hypothetical protein